MTGRWENHVRMFHLGVVLCGLLVAPRLLAQNGLKIVVIAGEDSVNVIQQGTAVAPIVEVRDRNDEPVGAAVVTFTVRNARSATLQGGARTVTTVTDAAGRATTTVNPLGQGRLEIQVRATYRGQTATTRITQQNVQNSPQSNSAQSAGSTGAQGGAAGGAAAASGGGSGLLVGGIIGAGVVGGAVAARELTRETTPDLQLPRTFVIDYATQGVLVVSRAGFPSCSVPYTETGSIAITLSSEANKVYSGTATHTENSGVAPTVCTFGTSSVPFGGQPSNLTITGPIGGPAERLEFMTNRQTANSRTDISFNGRLENDTVVGTYSKRYVGTAGVPPAPHEQRIDLDLQLTLR
jgi:hypothetical protein